MTSNQIDYNNYVEQGRHNKAVEQENVRHNKASEQISSDQNTEIARHNTETERIQWSDQQVRQLLQEISSDAAIQSALISSQGRVESSAISAAANRYAADLNRMTSLDVSNLNNEAQLRRLLEELETRSLLQLEQIESDKEIASKRNASSMAGSLGSSLINNLPELANLIYALLK